MNFDPDTAGANAAEKSIALLTEEGFEVKVVTLEGGQDPDRYIRERGAKEHMTALGGARQTPGLSTGAGAPSAAYAGGAKIKALSYLLPGMVRRMPNRNWAGRRFAMDAAQKLGIDSALVREELKEAAAKRRDSLGAQAVSSLTRAGRSCCRRFLLRRRSELYQSAEAAYLEHRGGFWPGAGGCACNAGSATRAAVLGC